MQSKFVFSTSFPAAGPLQDQACSRPRGLDDSHLAGAQQLPSGTRPFSVAPLLPPPIVQDLNPHAGSTVTEPSGAGSLSPLCPWATARPRYSIPADLASQGQQSRGCCYWSVVHFNNQICLSNKYSVVVWPILDASAVRALPTAGKLLNLSRDCVCARSCPLIVSVSYSEAVML